MTGKGFTELLRSRFGKNVSWILFSRVYQMLVSAVVSIVSVRYLGPANYGLINYAASFTSLLSAVCTLGIPEVMVNELIRQPKNQGKLLGTAIGMRLLSSALSVAAICLFTAALNPGEPLTFWVTAVYSGGMVLQSLETVQYFYQQRLMSKIPSLLLAVSRTVAAVYKIVLLISGRDVLWFAFSNVVDHGIFGLLLLLAYHRHRDGGQGLGLDPDLGKALLGKSHHFILAGLMVTLYGQMDKLMIKHLLDETQVGFYSAAVTVNNLWGFVLAALIDSARPLILDLFEKDREAYRQALTRLYSMVIFLSLSVSGIISLLAAPIVELLYGPAYRAAVSGLRIITWSTAFSYLGVARSIWMVPNGRQRYEKYLAAIGAACNFMLNLLMIPLWGIRGAALATVLTQIVTNCLCGVLFRPLRENSTLILAAFRSPSLLKGKKTKK